MIVNIAGTSGSGKSHLMRSVLAKAKKCTPVFDGTKVRGYELVFRGIKGKAYVLGAYDVPTGGCDTSGSAIEIFEMLPSIIPAYTHVLYEGLFVMNMSRAPQLAEEYGRDMCVIQLTTPLATCLTSVNARRAERGAGVLADTKNTQDNYRRATNYCLKMRDAGARVIRTAREDALEKILEVLGEAK